jgi:hypothetical protein
MKQWLAIAAAVAFLVLPVMGSASEDTIIPPEANWSPEPPTPAPLVASQERVASSTPKQGQASDSSWPFTAQSGDEDAKYQMVNATTLGE